MSVGQLAATYAQNNSNAHMSALSTGVSKMCMLNKYQCVSYISVQTQLLVSFHKMHLSTNFRMDEILALFVQEIAVEFVQF